jgi:hypothetical protein
MNEVKLGQILEDACRLAGREVLECAIPPGWKVLAAMTVNAGLRDLTAEKFPMMQRIEFRRYRPDWDSTVRYDVGHEVWYGDDYWRCESAAAGTPGADHVGWRKLKMEEVNAFIAWEQPWENTVMDLGGVDFNRFAYTADPRYNPSAAPIPGCAMCELGVLLPSPAPKGVYVRFIPVLPLVSFVDWRSDGSYKAGDVVYDETVKDVFVAVADIEEATEAPGSDTSGVWRPVRVRREFQTYLTRLVAADLMTEDQGKYQTRAAADRELDVLRERYHDGNGASRASVGSYCR